MASSSLEIILSSAKDRRAERVAMIDINSRIFIMIEVVKCKYSDFLIPVSLPDSYL